jgi:hypothetical protein
MVHGLSDLRDLGESLNSEVNSGLHHSKNRRKLPELIDLRRSQWICFEERNDLRTQKVLIENSIHEEILAMVISSAIPVHSATSKVALNQIEHMRTPLALHHCESRLHHPSDPHARIPMDRKTEAAFSVDEADDPLLDSWPFLLIARTGWFVTGHAPTIPGGSDMAGTTGYSGVPAYSQLHFTPSPA